jgi:hypothetical protein
MSHYRSTDSKNWKMVADNKIINVHKQRNIATSSNNIKTSWAFLRVFIPFHSKAALLWRFYVAGNNKTYLVFLVKCPIFLSDYNYIWVFITDFHKSSQYQISGKSVQWEPHW